MTGIDQDLNKAPRIRLHFNVHEPIELVEMTLAFQGLGYEYQTHLKNIAAEYEGKSSSKYNDVKLYITKIESNCILAELAPALPMLGDLAPIFTDIKTVSDFVKDTGKIIKWLIGLDEKDDLAIEDIPYQKRKISNVQSIVHLVAQNTDANLGLQSIKFESSSGEDRVAFDLNFTSDQCKQAEVGAVRVLKTLEVKSKADHERVLMYFHQTNREDPKGFGRTGDRAVINSINPKDKRVYIISELDQQKIRYVLDDKGHNPLHIGFVVDVNVETNPKGVPLIYRIVNLHDVLYDEDE
jgi:hypothetical protein